MVRETKISDQDCVAAADLQLPCGKNKKDTSQLWIIIADGPTIKTSTGNPQLGGAETNLDHKIVVTKIDLKGMFTIWSKKPQPINRIDVSKLPSDADLQQKLKEAVVIKLHNQGTISTEKDPLNLLVRMPERCGC